MSGLLHLTAGFPSNDDMRMLAASSVRHGYDFHALPRYWPAERLAKVQKLGVTRAYLESGEVRPDRIVLFTDAYDVLMLGPADSLQERFRASGVDILFSAEVNFFPAEDRDPRTRAAFEASTSKWRYLNSGCYVGFAWAVRELLRFAMALQDPATRSDQMLTQEFYRHCLETGRIRVGLDTVPSLFASLNASHNDFVLRGERVYGPASERPVLALHGNGDKGNLQILRQLWALLGDGTRAAPDLQLLQVGGQHVRYDKPAGRLARTGGPFANLVFALCHANVRMVLFTARDGCLTFTPEGRVDAGRDEARSWETLLVRGSPRTAHGRPLADYLSVAHTAAPRPEHFALALAREAEFATVVQHAVRLAGQLADRPGLDLVSAA